MSPRPAHPAPGHFVSLLRIRLTYYVNLCGIGFALATPGPAATSSGPTVPNAGVASPPTDPPAQTGDDLYQAGRLLFQQLATPELLARVEFPTRAAWDDFGQRFQRALAGDSLAELATYATEGRAALSALRLVPGYEDLADGLEPRLDELEGAQQAVLPPATPTPTAPTRPSQPPPPVTRTLPPVPHYDLWLTRVRGRPLPRQAANLMPKLKAAFIAEGIPPELAWLAEAESSLNPSARSPTGAKGLFQFMPDTAKSMGLSTLLHDERTHPEKSAHAAARYLRYLHGKFGNWALALAAYNAGEGRVSRTLAQQHATSFTAIADHLPAETRMYVPKVCALIAAREGLSPHQIRRPSLMPAP